MNQKLIIVIIASMEAPSPTHSQIYVMIKSLSVKPKIRTYFDVCITFFDRTCVFLVFLERIRVTEIYYFLADKMTNKVADNRLYHRGEIA